MGEEEIRIELAHLTKEVSEIKKTLQEVRDTVLTMPRCPQPGLCVSLRKMAEDGEDRLRALERQSFMIVGACGLLSLIVPIAITVAMKLFFKS